MRYQWIFGLVALIPIAACKTEPSRAFNHYPISAHDAYDKLVAADLSDFKLNRQCGILIHFSIDPTPETSVTWHVTSEGREQFSFSANLTPISATETQIDISVSKDVNGKEDYDGTPAPGDYQSQRFRRPAVDQPVRPAIRELINATLEDRKFDSEHVWNAEPEPGIPKPNESSDGVCYMQREALQHESAHFSINDPVELGPKPSQ